VTNKINQEYVLKMIEGNVGKNLVLSDLEKTLEDIGMDSIIFIKTVVLCETSLNITFEDEMLVISKFENLDQFVNYVISKTVN